MVGWSVRGSLPLSWSVGLLVSVLVSVLLAGWSVGWRAGDPCIVSNTRVEGGVNECDLFDLAGNQPCGRCAKAQMQRMGRSINLRA